MIYINLTISILALLGLLVARYIFKHKRSPAGTPFICPLHLDCDAVVNSKYGKTFGVHNEIGGMLYYGYIFILYFTSVISTAEIPSYLFTIANLATLGAFLFSLYLVFIMWRVLRAWCSWCISSAILSTTIALLTLYLLR